MTPPQCLSLLSHFLFLISNAFQQMQLQIEINVIVRAYTPIYVYLRICTICIYISLFLVSVHLLSFVCRQEQQEQQEQH